MESLVVRSSLDINLLTYEDGETLRKYLTSEPLVSKKLVKFEIGTAR